MDRFNIFYKKLLENMTTGSVLGTGQAHPSEIGKSGDFYAPGDARNIWGAAAPSKKKKKKVTVKKFPVIRRTFPKGL